MQLQRLHRTTRGGRGTGRRRTLLPHTKEKHISPWTKDVQVIINFGPVFVAPLSSDIVGEVPPIQSDLRKSASLRDTFSMHAYAWKNETQHWSSMPRITSHPSYLRIIGLAGEYGKNAVERLILQELESDPYHWFDALEAISGNNPVKADDDFDAAVNAWLEWGRQEGIIANDHPAGT